MLINVWMQMRSRIEEDASAFLSKYRSVSSDTGCHLQTALFALTGTCTLILALGCVELVGEGHAHTLVVVILRNGSRGADKIACHCIMLLVEDVIESQGYTQCVIFQE